MDPQPFKCHHCHHDTFILLLDDAGLRITCTTCTETFYFLLPKPLVNLLHYINPIPAERPVHENEGLP